MYSTFAEQILLHFITKYMSQICLLPFCIYQRSNSSIAPSISPANAGCHNRTSTSSIIVSYEPIPIAFIHGILKGYRIEYRLMSVESQSKSNSHVEALTVSPFRNQATLGNLEPNSVYEIRVMAVNEHGAGVKSPVFYGGNTLRCMFLSFLVVH